VNRNGLQPSAARYGAHREEFDTKDSRTCASLDDFNSTAADGLVAPPPAEASIGASRAMVFRIVETAMECVEAVAGEPKESTGVDSQAWSFHKVFALISISVAAIVWVCFRGEALSLDKSYLWPTLPQTLIPILIVAAYCHWAEYRRLREGCLLVAWSCLFVPLLPLPSYAAARVGATVQDGLLTNLDSLLGISVPSLVAWMRLHPRLNTFLMACYGLLQPLVLTAVILPPMAGKIRRARIFLTAVLLAALTAVGIFALFPAVGPWVSGAFTAYPNQLWYTSEFNLLRGSDPYTVRPQFSTGLITFPSFHVALSIMAAWTLWCFRWARIPVTLIACSISISTLTTGWHYGVDGIAGILLACMAIRIARIAC
jgi:PAP2 superfamily